MRITLISVSILLSIFVSSNALGQSVPSQRTEQEIKNLLCHKWQSVSMKVDGETMPMEEEGKAFYIIFLKDGTFIDHFEGHSPSNKWSYNHKTMTITTGGVVKKIIRINDKELVLTGKSDGVSTTLTLKRVD